MISRPAATTGSPCREVQTERLLATWVRELGALTGEREVTGFTQDDTGVDVALSDGTSIRADYLVDATGAAV